MQDLNQLTATQAAAAIAKREITSEQLVRACFARIREREPDVQAWSYLDETTSLAAARRADTTPAKSPLHGVPFGVKDVIDTGDMPTEYGSDIFRGNRPAEDAACVAHMKAAGAILLGKTVATEFATYRPGKTRNPHNFAHTPGGSSSGSAAAVGDFMVPMAFGNQTAGSHIRPASYCGICGFKPTHGTVDLTGIFSLEASFDTLGYYARSFDDIALFYGIVRGVRPEPLAAGLDRPPRVGFFRSLERRFAEPSSVAAVEAAARRLVELGAVVEEFNLPAEFDDLPETHPIILNAGLNKTLGEIYRQHRERISDRLRGMIEDGMQYPTEKIDRARAHAEACRARIDDAFGTFDVLLCPSAPGEAPKGLTSTGSPIFQVVWTLLHVPCATIPFAKGPNGLPVGIQFVGRRGADLTVLGVSKWFQARI